MKQSVLTVIEEMLEVNTTDGLLDYKGFADDVINWYFKNKVKRKLRKIMVEAWWRRTKPVIDLDTGKYTPSPTMKEWTAGVLKDLEKHGRN